jgi:hypothetical protein
MKANFKNLQVEVSFDKFSEVDVTKALGNYIHTNTTDIGLDDVAREIYYSEGEVEISSEHAEAIKQMVLRKDCSFFAAFKKAIISQLTA